MASRMNSGGSIDLNRIKIDPRTGEKFSFNLDKVAATAWYGQERGSHRADFKVKSMVRLLFYQTTLTRDRSEPRPHQPRPH